MRLYPGAALMASLLFCTPAGVIGAENDPALSTVNGRVLERGTRRPVASAVVEIVPGREPVYTDRAGLFTVDSVPAGVHAASVAAIGYRVFRQDISVTRSVEGVVFRLEPEGGLLQEVEVVARAREGTARQQVISGGELRQVPATAGDPLRAVTALPGINPGSDIDSNLYVRGSGPNDSALYADGVPAGYPYHYQGLASTFQTGTVKDLRFYSGGFPARYGDRMGGIFDITTQRASPDRITGSLGFSAIMSGATVEAPLPVAGATGIFAFRQGYGDLVMPRHAKDVAVPRFSDYLARVDLPESSGARVRLEAFGAEDAAKAMVRRSTSDLVGSFKWHHAFHVGALTWDQRWDDSLETTVMASANTTENELDLGQNYYFDVKPSGLFGRAEARKSAGRHMFTAGTECAYTEYLMDVFFARLPMEGQGAYNWTSLSKLRLSGRMYGTNGGAYLSDRVRVAGPLEVEAGGRLDTYSLTDAFRASPRVSARMPITPEARVFGAWGLYNQSPQPMELMPIWGNPKLLPNRAWHSIVGIETNLGSWTASVEAYDKRFEDLVTPDAESVYSNDGSGHSRGVELLLRRSFAERLAGWVGYSRSVAMRRDNPGGPLRLSDYDIPDTVSVVGRWLVTRDVGLSGRWRYATGTPYTRILGERIDSAGEKIPVFGPVNGARLPPYRRLDIRLEYNWRLDDLVVVPFLELLNALDARNLATTVWSTEYGGERRIEQLPRLVFGGIEARF